MVLDRQQTWGIWVYYVTCLDPSRLFGVQLLSKLAIEVFLLSVRVVGEFCFCTDAACTVACVSP